jgi:signal transduction histidine kinase
MPNASTPMQHDRVKLLSHPWVRLILYLLFWTLLGLLNVSQSYFLLTTLGRPFNIWMSLVFGLTDWYIWAALAPIVVYVGRCFPLGQRRWAVHVPLHMMFSVVCAFVTTLLFYPVFVYMSPPVELPEPFWKRLEISFMREIHLYLWVYWAILGVGHAIDYYRRYRERELSTAQLAARLAEAQLQVLKMQLDPHFLFNTLHAVTTLVHKSPESAEVMLTRLSDMLRMSLETSQTHEVPLRDELRLLEPYLEIQRVRFGSRLSVEIKIDPSAANGLVPNLILQPLVENAIRHGIEPQLGAGWVRIEAMRDGKFMAIHVSDNGPGFPDGSDSVREGVGISNTMARLRYLYGEDYQFAISNGAGHGAVITLVIPWHTIDDDPKNVESSSDREHSHADRG